MKFCQWKFLICCHKIAKKKNFKKEPNIGKIIRIRSISRDYGHVYATASLYFNKPFKLQILRFDFRSLWNQNVCTLYHWYGHIFSHAFISLPKKKSESVFHSSNSPFLNLFHFLSVNLFPSFFICILLIHIRVWHWSEKALRTTLTLSHFLVLFVCHTVYNVHRTAGTYLWIQYIYNNLAYYACIECILYCTHKTTTQFIRSAAAVDNCVSHAYVNPTLCLLLA